MSNTRIESLEINEARVLPAIARDDNAITTWAGLEAVLPEGHPILQDKRNPHTTSDRYVTVGIRPYLEQIFDMGGKILNPNLDLVAVNSKAGESFGKFMIKITFPEFMYDDKNIQLWIMSAHDGTSSVKMGLGALIGACWNGCFFGEVFFSARVRHQGLSHQRIADVIKRVKLEVPRVNTAITTMQERVLNDTEKRFLALEIANERLKDVENVTNIDINKMLTPRRIADQEDNSWKTYNILQENIIRGGIKYNTVKKEWNNLTGRYDETTKKHTTRELRSINANTSLNSFVFKKVYEHITTIS